MTTATAEATSELRTLISRLAHISQLKTELEAEEKQLKTTLREQLHVGDKVTVNGSPVLQLQPNRRFSPDLARTLLPADLLQLCLVETVDAKKARAVLPPAAYTSCCAEHEPRVVLL